MTILSDRQIEAAKIITPFIPHLVDTDVISYGSTSFGYDARVSRKFRVMKSIPFWRRLLPWGRIPTIDPKRFDPRLFHPEVEADYIDIPPHGFALGSTLEHFAIPPDVSADVVGKSTYARSGLHVLVTPFEAGWKGYATLEFANLTNFNVRLYAGEGACQVRFYRGSERCRVSYADRKGKYQNQGPEPTLPTLVRSA